MKSKRGQSMFELLVAVFVIALTLTALVGLVSTSISNTNFSRERTLASKYTQEAVEWLRQERDISWAAFITQAGVRCLGSLSWSSGCAISGTAFSRQVTL